MQHMLAETNTLSLHMIHMKSWFVRTVNYKEMVSIAEVVAEVVK